MESRPPGTIRDFRAGTIWIYVVMFTAQAFFYRHRMAWLSWILLFAAALLFAGAVHFLVQRRSVELRG